MDNMTATHYVERERKSIDWLMAVQTTLVGVATLILSAGVPWAYVIGNRIAIIETTISATNDAAKSTMATNTATIREHEHRITELETEMKLLKQFAEQAKIRQAKGNE